MDFKERQEAYNIKQKEAINKIKMEPNKFIRFLKYLLYIITFPFTYIYMECHDYKFFIIFVIVCILVSVEVWLPYILGIILKNNWLIGVATTCWAFWFLPGTPFLFICVAITIGIKSLFDKLIKRTKKNEKK